MKDRILVKALHGNYWTWKNDLITQQLIEHGAHTRNELQVVLDHIEPSDIVIDIGAHIGTFTIPIAKKLTEGQIYAIESDPDNFQLLSSNIDINGIKSVCESYNFLATGMRLETRQAWKIQNNSGANFYTLPSEHRKVIKGKNLATWISDEDIDKVDFIKIDIEGMEFEILSAITHILERDRPKLYVEIVKEQLDRNQAKPKDIQKILDSIGYEYYVNTGDRNSSNDEYSLKQISDFEFSTFFDVLALPLHQ